MNREHAIIEKRIINLDHAGDRHVMCAWDDCENDGVELHMTRVNYGAPGYEPRIVKHVFCSERHRQFWINSTVKYGSLPPGFARSFILFHTHLRNVFRGEIIVLPPLKRDAGIKTRVPGIVFPAIPRFRVPALNFI